MLIGDFLRELRSKMTLREASEKSGLSHSYIRYLEMGKRPGSNTPINPTPETLKKLSEAYDYPYEELMLAAGYIHPQLTMDTETGEIRTQTLEENKNKFQHLNKVMENDIEKLFNENEFISYDGKILDKNMKSRIIDMIGILTKK